MTMARLPLRIASDFEHTLLWQMSAAVHQATANVTLITLKDISMRYIVNPWISSALPPT